ncbi:Protein kinase-like domain [Pseudocohnilembus persalinus]|uniref:Protein kinase-like domain n=1 Tax=Pseudocohnilembus persalinus TaxID=266149 RepID=A0A0V0QQS3_PSEPJ|nr:Protein kinase-like domain [Pseudocohnilembus persalinus]|eukprot:KRX04309.1 Protein kinase-like domain [Pseudocohnilembus persalinus]
MFPSKKKFAGQLPGSATVGYIIISDIPNCGKFGRVYPLEKNGKKFALKILLNDSKYHDDNDIERELQSLLKIKDIKNKNILTLHEYYYPDDKQSIGLVTEFYPKTLKNIMERFCYKKTKQSKYIQFSLKEAKNVIIQLLNGYYYLLKENIIHRDIKPENIFIDKNGLYILGDFGSSKQSNKDSSKNITIRGTMPYIAPEILQVNYGIKQEYDYKCDIFSLGVLLYQLITCELPIKNIRDQKIYVQNNLKKEVDNINFNIIQDENAKEVIQKMLQFEPSDRIDFHSLIVHKFFNDDMDLQDKESSISEKDQITKKGVKVVVDQHEQLDTIESMQETDSAKETDNDQFFYNEPPTLFTKVKQIFNDQNLDEDAKQLNLQKLRGYLIETLQIDYYIENYDVDLQLNYEKIQQLPLEKLINFNDKNYNDWKQK